MANQSLQALVALTADELATTLLVADDDVLVTEFLSEQQQQTVNESMATWLDEYFGKVGEWPDYDAWLRQRAEFLLAELKKL